MTNDELEEKGLIEVCKHCKSAYIIDIGYNIIMCANCGAEGYVDRIKEEDYEKNTGDS